MDLGKAFSFQFEDKRWLNKLGLAVLITLVPVLNFAFSGYVLDLLRNVSRKVDEPLPEWDDLGRKFIQGWILVLASLIYALPILIVICLPLSLVTVGRVLSGNANLQNSANSIGTAGGVLFSCLLCLFLLYLLLLSIIHPAITILFSREGTFASCFRLREALKLIQGNPSQFFTAWIGYVAATFLAGLVIGIFGWIPCLGQAIAFVLSLASVVYVATVYAHLFGQFAVVGTGGDRGSSSS